MDIVFLALARWDGPYSSTTFSLAKEFAKNHRVFYIENPLTLKYIFTNFFKREIRKRIFPLFFARKRYNRLVNIKGDLTIVTPPAVLPLNFFRRGTAYNVISAFNDKLIGGLLKDLLICFDIKDFIFINVFNPFHLRRFPMLFRPMIFVYITVDDIANSSYVSKHGPYLEEEIIKRVDFVFCTSTELKRLMERFSSNVFLLPNAADIEIFKCSNNLNTTRPDDISSIQVPIIVYTGHIDVRIDYELLVFLLQKLTTYCFLMIGPHSLKSEQILELEMYPNIKFIGRKRLEELPAYLKYAACAIIPFKCNSLTKSIYPLKINEYLASGKPVVSTPFSEDIIEFSDVIRVAQSNIEFAEGIREYIENGKSSSSDQVERRLKFVENNNWKNRVSMFWDIVNSPAHN